MKRVRFEDKTIDYINTSDDPSRTITSKSLTGTTNPETWSLMKDRFVVLRNFIPKEITDMSLNTWKTIEGNKQYDDAIFYREHEITQGSPKESLGKSKAGIVPHMQLHCISG